MNYQPFDWVAAPRGTNVAVAYAQLGMNNAFNSTTAGKLPASILDSQIGVARYLHYEKLSAISIFSTSFSLSALSPTARSMASASATPPAWPIRSSPSAYGLSTSQTNSVGFPL